MTQAKTRPQRLPNDIGGLAAGPVQQVEARRDHDN